MPILDFNVNVAGQAGNVPNYITIETDDSIAVVTAAGYLNGLKRQGEEPLANTTLAAVTTRESAGANPISNWYSVQYAAGDWSLVLRNSGSYATVTLPTVSGDLAVFTNTAGNIANGPVASTLVLNNQVNTLAAGASIVLPKVNGTEAANAVTASGVAGVITTSSLTTAAGASYAITWTNTRIATTSTVLLVDQGGTNTVNNLLLKVVPGAGTATLTIYNNDPTAPLDGTLLIGYAVF